MNITKYKKAITAVIFLGGLLIFSLVNLFTSADVFGEIGENFGVIRSKTDLVSWIKDAESEINDGLLLHDRFVDLNSIVQKILGKQEINNFSIIRGDDGMLYYGAIYNAPNDDVDVMTGQIVKLHELTESKNENFIVMLPPSKILYGLSDIDMNMPLNDPNSKMDKLLSQLQQRRVTTLDLRQAMLRSGDSVSELFFKTDHHWTPKAAFYGMQELVKLIQDEFGENLDPEGYYCNPDNYTVESYPNIMLGTHGRKTGRFYSGLDDFDLIYLTDYNNTKFVWENYEKKKKQGNLKESLLHMEKIETENYYKQDIYAVYIDAVNDHDSIVNKKNKNGAKIAVLRDSYFSPTAVFLAPMCSTIDMFWNQDSESVKLFLEEIERNSYDYVILEVYPYNLNTKTIHFFEEN